MVTDVRTRKINRITAFIIFILTAVFGMIGGLNFNVSAEGTGSAELICQSDDDPLIGMTWRIYYVGSRSGNELNLGGDFSEYAVTFGDMSADALMAAASTLENYAILDGIKPYDNGVTDSDGKVKFTNLQTGIYLVSGDKLSVGEGTYVPAPMLVEVSKREPDVVAYPKFTDVLDSGFERMTVKKIWENDENYLEDRSVSIDVELYCNSELKETVTLNEKNDWTYSWDAKIGDTWRVLEIDIPDNYTVTYRSNQTQYVIVNTYDSPIVTTTTTTTSTSVTTTTTSDDTVQPASQTTTVSETTTLSKSTIASKSTTTSKSESKLPQTGQLWWPVPILALGGIIFVGIGFSMISRSKKEDD